MVWYCDEIGSRGNIVVFDVIGLGDGTAGPARIIVWLEASTETSFKDVASFGPYDL